MKRRLRAAYGAVAAATLTATVVLMACEPKDLGAATHAEWSAAVDLSVLIVGPASGDAVNGVERERPARRAAPRS